jgi:hypothetical protein
MNDKTYNGWTNYATWRVNLEVFDGLNLRDWFDREQYPTFDLYEVSEWAKEYAESVIDDTTQTEVTAASLVSGWARAFLSDVDWYSIGRHLIENASEVDA